MRVDKTYSNNYYNNVNVRESLQTVEQSAEQQKKSAAAIDEVVSMNI